MKSSILLLAFIAIAFSNCTTAYKTGQTPDDVYFSPAPPPEAEEYVTTRKNNDDRKYKGDYNDDRYLRMKVQNRNRWSDLDEWYNYDRYNIYYSHSNSWNNPWNSYSSWNYFHNPYCQSTVVVNPKNTTYNKPRTFNLNTYQNDLLTNKNYSAPKSTSNPKTNQGDYNYNNSNNNSGFGNTLRNIFGTNNNSNNNSGSSTSGSSGSSSSGSSGTSGSSAPVRKF